jgi:Ser/Thr protein kinase RdoA (MazF antagonist)
MPPKDMGEDEIRAFLTHLATERKFAVSKVEPGEPVTGSGAVAQVTLTGMSAGTFDLTLSADILSDRDAHPVLRR